MTRLVVDSINGSDTMAAVQIFTTDVPRIVSITMKARSGNVGSVFLADDSAALSSGLEVLAGDREDWDFAPATVKGSSIWVMFADSGDDLDFAALMED